MRLPAARRRLAAVAVAIVAVAAAGCSGDDGASESFEQDVVQARDKADSALAHIQRPTSTRDLVVRLRTARDDLATASGEIAVADAPDELADERRRLAGALSDLAQEMDGAANSVELLVDAPGQVDRLIFDQWQKVQDALLALRDEGIDVEPLQNRGSGGGS